MDEPTNRNALLNANNVWNSMKSALSTQAFAPVTIVDDEVRFVRIVSNELAMDALSKEHAQLEEEFIPSDGENIFDYTAQMTPIDSSKTSSAHLTSV